MKTKRLSDDRSRSIITRLFYKIDRDELCLRTYFVHIIIPNRATVCLRSNLDRTKSETKNKEHGCNKIKNFKFNGENI